MPRTGISSGTLRSVIEYGLPLPLPLRLPLQTGHLWQYHFDTHTCWCWRSTSVRRVDIFRDTSYTTRPTYIYKLSTKFYLINLLRDKNNICHTTPMKQTNIFAQICSSWRDFNRPSMLACLLTLRQLRFLFTLRVDRCLKHVDRDAQSRRASISVTDYGVEYEEIICLKFCLIALNTSDAGDINAKVIKQKLVVNIFTFTSLLYYLLYYLHLSLLYYLHWKIHVYRLLYMFASTL